MLMNNYITSQNITKSDLGPEMKGKLHHVGRDFMEKVNYR